ncbi:hypothetical protein RBSWK_05643 [Rhodopirellula baltica SWK14]|uniref:Uncharacterized protein n=1 Tax=Rhodopirellula baltica SWK14 TaxID=993516 RepID=L7CB99_RHOBT|nr:hypothetical protein RBSWK_05643 [Rhodopirellula baltica SWK14]
MYIGRPKNGADASEEIAYSSKKVPDTFLPAFGRDCEAVFVLI